MKQILILLFFLNFIFISCNQNKSDNLPQILEGSPFIEGKSDFLGTPYVTAGNRVYMVGHQNGTFPELGWHIKGEMGGIWNHPIKLMDGFEVDFLWDRQTIKLNNATSFINYPFANKHIYNLSEQKIQVERWQFVPDEKEGIIVQFVLKNTGETTQDFKLRFKGQTDLRPTWLGERTQMYDGDDKAVFKNDMEAWLVKDSLNPWFVAYGANEKVLEYKKESNIYSGKGVSRSLLYDISLPAKETKIITFSIAGSYISEQAAIANYKDLQTNFSLYANQKKLRYQSIASKSKLTIPDKKMEQTFEWLKYNSDWLIRTVPEIGTGIAAGLPDYPWWFGVDSEYALKGYSAIGRQDIVRQTIALLDSTSNKVNGNGQIIHEMSTNGAVFNKGNINETPQFASLIWEVYLWNGDLEFLKKYFATIKKGLHWLMSEKDKDSNLFPDGFGMMEIHGLDSEMVDVAVYTQRAFQDASKIATELDEHDLAEQYKQLAITLKEKINNEFWSEEFNSYADFIGTDAQAIKLIEDAIIRADTLKKPWAVKELQQTKKAILKNPSKTSRPFVLHHNWVVNTPMEMNISENDKALRALETAEKFVNPFGVFVTGIDRDESAGSDDGSFKGSKVFSYTGAVMTLPTGVLTVAENNYGRPNNALNYLKKMSRTFSYALPGSMYEVSPDYGMMSQAWNIYGFAIPIVQQFFGINPYASKKKIVIQLQMPDEWNEATLENVEIADNKISIFYKNIENKMELKITQTNPDWLLEIPIKKGKIKEFEVRSGKVDILEQEDQFIFSSKDSIMEIDLQIN